MNLNTNNINQSMDRPEVAIHKQKSTLSLQILLKEKDADVDVESREGYTPLHAAVVSGSVEICQLLVSV